MQVQEQSSHMWNQAQAALQKVSPMQMPIKQQQKQQQQAFYMAAQDPLKMYEHQLQSSAQVSSMDKKMKYPDVKLQDFYWDSSYRIGDSLAVLADRMKRPSPGGICSEQDGPRGPPFEVSCCQQTQREEFVLLLFAFSASFSLFSCFFFFFSFNFYLFIFLDELKSKLGCNCCCSNRFS